MKRRRTAYDFEKAVRSELGRWMSVGLQGLVYDDVSMIKLIFAGPHDRCS
jgi:hypothetical protein